MGRETNFTFFEEASRLDTGNTTDLDVKTKLKKVISETQEEEQEEEEQEETTTEQDQEEEENQEEEEEQEQEQEESEDEHSEESEEIRNTEEAFDVFATTLVNADVLKPRDGITYPASEEGIQLLTEHTVEDRVSEIVDEVKSIVLNPELNATLGDLLQFIEDGGDPKEFFRTAVDTINYDEIALDDEGNQILLITNKAILEGLEESEIEELIEDLKVAGQLEKQAKIAHRILAKNQQTEFENIKKQQEATKKQLQEAQAKRVEEFKTKVYSLPSIGSIELTEKEKGKFYDYMTKGVKKSSTGEWLTQFEIDNDAEQKRLEMAYIMFKGGIGSIEKKAKTEASGNLKMALSKTKDTMLSRNSQSTPTEEKELKTKKTSKIFVPDPNLSFFGQI